MVTGFYVAVEVFKTTLEGMSGAVGWGGRLHLTLRAAEGVSHIPRSALWAWKAPFQKGVILTSLLKA